MEKTAIDFIDYPSELFITGTGTDVGKTIATGWLAAEMDGAGYEVITLKMIQTGNREMSEDIIRHREIMGIPMQTVDKLHLTAPIIYSYPASPHLAAEIDNSEVDLSLVDSARESLLKQYAHLLTEGAGGLMVPIKGEYLTADYLRDRKIPTMVVINGQLGSINHALLTLNAIKSYGIPLFGVIYNPYFDKDEIICTETKKYLKKWIATHFNEDNIHRPVWLDMPLLP